jgi:hypothetical protein
MQQWIDDMVSKGANLGNRLSETTISFSGVAEIIVWMFERAAIYWMPQVNGGSVIPVTGWFFAKYKSLGAHDVNPQTNTRLLGFPVSNQKLDENALRQVMEFENGVIYDTPPMVVGDGVSSGVAVFGGIYRAWKDAGGSKGELGYPVGELFNYHGGHAVYFERGCMWQGTALNGKVITSYVRAPLLGKPKLIDPTKPSDLAFKEMVAFVGLTPQEIDELNKLVPPPVTPDSGKGTFFSNLWKNLFLNRVIKAGEATDNLRLPPIDNSILSPVFDDGTVGSVGGIGSSGTTPSRTGIIVDGSTDGFVFVPTGSSGTTPSGTGSAPPGPHDDRHVTPSASIVGAEGPDWSDRSESGVFFLDFLIPAGSHLKERGLYELVMNLPGRLGHTVSPNCVYVKKDWSNFGFVHVTDVHANRRHDHFGNILRTAAEDKTIGPLAPWAEGADKCQNFNDNFRHFIRYANHLFDEGKLDFILNTGDLVDTITEGFVDMEVFSPDGRYSFSAGNFLFFEQLVLGKNPPTDNVRKTPNERLRVPMFTILGNHDYRYHTFRLRFKIDTTLIELPFLISGDPILIGGIILAKHFLDDYLIVKMFDAHGLKAHEADLLTWGLDNYKKEVGRLQTPDGNPAPSLLGPKTTSAGDAIKMVALDKSEEFQRYYHAKINRNNSYVLNLGRHRIVMLDVKHDIDIPIGDTGAIFEYIWKFIVDRSEGQEDAFSGGPQSKGFDTDQLQLVEQAISEAKSGAEKGIVVIGIHNGPINLKTGAPPNFLRTTIHPHLDPQVIKDYLIRQQPAIDTLQQAAKEGWQFSGTPFFKTGSNGFMLDTGFAKENSNEFMKICAGTEFQKGKNADLILYGHHHQHVEYIIKWENEQMNNLAYYTDHFTFNPPRYYCSPNTLPGEADDPVRIIIKEGANPTKLDPIKLKEIHDETGKEYEVWELETPPYSIPLETQADKAQWWRIHSPLYLETAALGPLDTNDRRDPKFNKMANNGLHFQGARLIRVENNIISTIKAIRLDEMRRSSGSFWSLRQLLIARGISAPTSIRSHAEEIRRIPEISERLKIQ